jgi:glucose-1-phosphate adenylyltransferase
VENTLTMVLAGGRNKRMDILCRHKVKPALFFAGSKRIIDYALSNSIHSGCKNIAVIVDYHRVSMSVYLSRWMAVNGASRNFTLLEPKYGAYHGNADAVYQNISYLKRHGADLVLVLTGDTIYRLDYSKILEQHRKTGAEVTIAITPVPIEQAQRFGVVTTDNNSRVTNFLEKPEIPQSNLVSMAIYVFSKHLLIERLTEDAAIASSPHDFGHAILPRMIRQNNVMAYKFNGYWRDAGTLQSYYDAEMEILPEKHVFTTDAAWPVYTEPSQFEPPKVTSKGSVQNSVLSPGCVVKGQVLNSILSPGVWVEEEAVVRDSIIMSNSYIGYHSVVDHCVLSESVNVGRLCYLGFGGGVNPGEGVTVLGDQVTVPPHTAIGRNCKILPHTGLTDFTRKVIPSDCIISPVPSRKTDDGDELTRELDKHPRTFRIV